MSFREGADYYEARELGLGEQFREHVSVALGAIQASPNRNPLQKNGARRAVLKRFPYVIHYVELPETIWILAVAHTSRRPDYWKRRVT